MSILVFVILNICTSLLDFYIVYLAKKQKKSSGKYLAGTMLFAGGVSLLYLLSVFSQTYFQMALSSGALYAFIDIMLIYLLAYIIKFTHFHKKKISRYIHIVLVIYALFDVFVEIINPFKEIAMHYEATDTITHWRLEPLFLYELHLIYSYIVIAIVLAILVYSTIKTPSVYRNRYIPIICSLIIVVGINGIYLYMQNGTTLDVSVLFYSAIGFYLYWNNFYYAENGMLNHVRQMLLDQMGQPVTLFDNNDLLTMRNKEVDLFFPKDAENGVYTINEFVQHMGFDERLIKKDRDANFQFVFKDNDKDLIFRCDYKILRDEKNKVIGRMFIFTDKSLEVDILTGFHSKGAFEKAFENKNPLQMPVGIAICDLNRLAELNKQSGEIAGDKAIQKLSDCMRKNFSQDSYFARMNDANLLVMSPNTTLSQMREHMANVRKDINKVTGFNRELDIQSSISVITSETENVVSVADATLSSMRTRKLLDTNSAHSSLLDSLAQTQQESDSCTEEHVKRTRYMGRMLGLRLGLTDVELGNLELLCLLHDIGKLGIPLEILNKPGKLNDAEWVMMRSHVDKGYRIAMASPELKGIADFILHHHECWNGSGYPDGLKQENIPILSRVIAVVDTFDAMTNDRPYRKAKTYQEAIDELKRFAGIQFDPHITSEFIDMLHEEMIIDTEVKADNSKSDITDKNKDSKKDTNKDNKSGEDANETFTPGGISDIANFSNNQTSEYINTIKYSKYILDENEFIVSVDDNFESFTGYTKEDIKEYKLSQFDLIFVEDIKEYQKLIAEIMPVHHIAFIEHRLRRKDGGLTYVFCIGRHFYDSVTKGQRVEITIMDVVNTSAAKKLISEAKSSAERSAELLSDNMRKDPLTRILNREAYKNDIELNLLKDNEKVMYVMIDIDYFKEFNDTYGHVRGDELLVKVASYLGDALGEDGLIGRLGGDEFSIAVFMSKKTTEEEAREKLNDIWSSVSSRIKMDGYKVTFSMGAVLSDEHKNTFGKLYKEADEKLYEAKQNGRNRAMI